MNFYWNNSVLDEKGVINSKGKFIIPTEWDAISDFENNFAVVERNGKYGIISLSGELIIAAVLDKQPDLFQKLLLLQHNDKLAWYNLQAHTFMWIEEGY